MDLPARVYLREVAPRDGFQSLSRFIPTEQKLKLVKAMIQAGIRNFETTSFVSPKAIPQLQDGAELMALVPRENVTHAALVVNARGAQNAVDAAVDQIVVVISATDAHNLANVRRSVQDSLAELDAIFSVAHRHGVLVNGAVAVSFGCPFSGDVPIPDVFRIADAYFARQGAMVIFADTTGMATPKHVDELVRRFGEEFGERPFALHFHNNRGSAMANLLAALLAGATIFDTSLGGIGGCPNVPRAAGNLATEDVVCMLEDMGVETGIDLEALIRAAKSLEHMLGYALPGQVMKSGPRLARSTCETCVTVPNS